MRMSRRIQKNRFSEEEINQLLFDISGDESDGDSPDTDSEEEFVFNENNSLSSEEDQISPDEGKQLLHSIKMLNVYVSYLLLCFMLVTLFHVSYFVSYLLLCFMFLHFSLFWV